MTIPCYRNVLFLWGNLEQGKQATVSESSLLTLFWVPRFVVVCLAGGNCTNLTAGILATGDHGHFYSSSCYRWEELCKVNNWHQPKGAPPRINSNIRPVAVLDLSIGCAIPLPAVMRVTLLEHQFLDLDAQLDSLLLQDTAAKGASLSRMFLFQWRERNRCCWGTKGHQVVVSDSSSGCIDIRRWTGTEHLTIRSRWDNCMVIVSGWLVNCFNATDFAFMKCSSVTLSGTGELQLRIIIEGE